MTLCLLLPLGNSVGPDVVTEHPLLSEPSSVSFYNWMSNAVGNRGGGNAVPQESPVNRSQHNILQTGRGNVVRIFSECWGKVGDVTNPESSQ